MKVTLKNEDWLLEFSDEELDNDNFVNVCLENDKGDRFDWDFPLSEIMPAIIAFDAKRSRRLSEEND